MRAHAARGQRTLRAPSLCSWLAARAPNALLASRSLVLHAIEQGKVDYLYVSPERWVTLVSEGFFEGRGGERLMLLVIDEAHCVCEWDTFRADYARLGETWCVARPLQEAVKDTCSHLSAPLSQARAAGEAAQAAAPAGADGDGAAVRAAHHLRVAPD